MYYDRQEHPEPDIFGIPHHRHHHLTYSSNAPGKTIVCEVVLW